MKVVFKKGVSAKEISRVIEQIEDNYKITIGKLTLYFLLQEQNTRYELYDLWGEPLVCEVNSRNIEGRIQEVSNCIAIPCNFKKAIEILRDTDKIHMEAVKNKIFWFFSYLVGIYNEQTETFLLNNIKDMNFEAAYDFLDAWIGLDELEGYIIYYMKERREY